MPLINWWVVGPTATTVALAGACAFLVSDLGKVREQRDAAKGALSQAASACDALRFEDQAAAWNVSRSIEVQAAEAARICRSEGSESFNRGMEIGRASCAAG
jgi:hypothetical protein